MGVSSRKDERPTWSGAFDAEEIDPPGLFLTSALIECSSNKKISIKEMNTELNVRYAYINHLRNGTRPVKDKGFDFI